MSKAEILAELPKLSPADRVEIWEQLRQLETHGEPTPAERNLLDEAQADYDSAPQAQASWDEVAQRLRLRK